MTLSDDKVMKLLNRNFVCAWKNISGKEYYAGTSNTHMPTYSAKTVTNCAGHHNVQMFFLTPDGRVLHCLPGFWAPEHFIHEADLAVKLARVYAKKVSPVKRNELYLNLHLEHALEHDKKLRDASRHQGFDKLDLAKRKDTDFKREGGYLAAGGLKTPDQVMHERMAEMSFVPLEKFNVAKYVDMGLKKYKYDYGVPGKGK